MKWGLHLAVAGGVALALLGSASAFGAWHQPVGGTSPINRSSGQDASQTSLADVNGVPYVAWTEDDGANSELRIARLNATGTAWDRVADGSSPINESPAFSAGQPSLASINGVPWVAWYETDGTNSEIRVARLNAAGTAWEKVADSASPINKSNTMPAFSPSLTAIGGVPYVAWAEMDGVNNEIRVARLNTAGTAWDKVADGASPINKSPTQNGFSPSLQGIGGVPYVAWIENDGTNNEVRVARLNTAGTAWDKVADGASPINETASTSASAVSMTSIAGVPYVAWPESDGTNDEMRVARLNAGGTAWDKVADSASPINESPSRGAFSPSIAAIGGVPYVAWYEDTGTGYEIRVARLDAAGSAWEKVADSASPINQAPNSSSFSPSLAPVNGVPFVAWHEQNAGGHFQIRVSRLEPDFVSQTVIPGATTASLSATWHTYGLPFPIGFDYGASLESSTTPQPAAAGSDTATVTQEIAGLSPSSPYQFRSFANAGTLPELQAPTSAVFQTTPPPDTEAPETKITKEPKNKSAKSKAKYKFTSNEPNSTFTCKFDKAKPKPCDSGKAKYKHLDDGKHKFTVIATDAAGNADPSAAKDKFKVL